jgi:PTH2 family peptidyl-tRNA hydrolase
MRKGKMVSQGSHASLGAILNLLKENPKALSEDPRVKPWVDGAFTKICVSVNSEEELLDIYNKCKESGIITVLICDAGKTEFNGVPTHTTVAVGPDEESKVNAITGHLKLL